jgi:hypothetical protein
MSACKRSICCALVSTFFTEVVQQIHSSRPSGVSAFHFSTNSSEDSSATRRSAGTLCATPLASFLVMSIVYINFYGYCHHKKVLPPNSPRHCREELGNSTPPFYMMFLATFSLFVINSFIYTTILASAISLSIVNALGHISLNISFHSSEISISTSTSVPPSVSVKV